MYIRTQRALAVGVSVPGVRYNEETNIYYGEIKPYGHDEAVPST